MSLEVDHKDQVQEMIAHLEVELNALTLRHQDACDAVIRADKIKSEVYEVKESTTALLNTLRKQLGKL